MNKNFRRFLTVLLVLFSLFAVYAQGAQEDGIVEETGDIRDFDSERWFSKYGNVYTDIKVEDFFDEGFAEGDIVRVSFRQHTLELPVVPTYSYVDQGSPAVIAHLDEDGNPDGYIALAINMGNFATAYGLAEKTINDDKSWYWTPYEGVTFPIEISFEMAEQGGYLDSYLLYDLTRTNDREDYSDLTDEEFANFRAINTTGMGKNRLYRTSSPINSWIERNVYADRAAEQAGITVFLNLADSADSADDYEDFEETYYASQKIVYLNLGVDFQAPDFQAGLAEGLRFIAANEGVYAIHCTEGTYLTGFVSALLECFMGATYDEVISDYMTTYENYYRVEKGSEKYNEIADGNIVRSLCAAFRISDLASADLKAEAEAYILGIGLTPAEVSALRANLSK